MTRHRHQLLCALLMIGCGTPSIGETHLALPEVDYDIVYVRYPRRGDTDAVQFPDGETPYAIEPGADLVLLHPDGSQEVLVDCRGRDEDPVGGEVGCSVQDPVISFDGRWVYYAKYVDLDLNHDDRWFLRTAGDSFIFKMQLDAPPEMRSEIQLTDASSGIATHKLYGNADADIQSFGIRDLGPVQLASGAIGFTSNREAIVRFTTDVAGEADPDYQLVSQLHQVDDHDGSTPNRNLQLVGHSQLNHAQHPTLLRDGRLLFTFWDDAGLREQYGSTTLYTSSQSGGHMAQFLEPHVDNKRVDHFATQLTTGHVISPEYYPTGASFGFGTLFRYDTSITGPRFTFPERRPGSLRYFPHRGWSDLTPHTDPRDCHAPGLSGRYTTPSAGPAGQLLTAWADGPVIRRGVCAGAISTPRPDSGLYLFENAGNEVIDTPSRLLEILDDPAYNEIWPRAVLPYETLHGMAPPTYEPDDSYAPTARDRGWVRTSPIGITGTSSMLNRESTPASERFNDPHGKGPGGSTGWVIQGTDAGRVRPEDYWGVRVLVSVPDRNMEPYDITGHDRPSLDSRMRNTVKGYESVTREVWKVLGEFPSRNPMGTPDPDGSEDTSWLAWVPANTPFLIQALDQNGMTLYSEQTWRHVEPGDTNAACGGCHAHSIPGVPFAGRWADREAYAPRDLVNTTPLFAADGSGTRVDPEPLVELEFRRDVYPVLERECAECHASSGDSAPSSGGRLALFDSSLSGIDAEFRAYVALIDDADQSHTYGTSIPGTPSTYLFPQLSRYVRALQARASLFVWKIYGARLDGRTNDELPAGEPRDEDLDYEVGSCPAPSRLTAEERLTMARWIDTGANFDFDVPRQTATDDHAVPVLHVELTEGAGGRIVLRAGLLDLESGIDEASFTARVDAPDGSTQTVHFSDLTWDPVSHVGSVELSISAGMLSGDEAVVLHAEVRDLSGNLEELDRYVGGLPPDPGTVTPRDAGTLDPDGSDVDGGTTGGGGSSTSCGCATVGAATPAPWLPLFAVLALGLVWRRRAKSLRP